MPCPTFALASAPLLMLASRLSCNRKMAAPYGRGGAYHAAHGAQACGLLLLGKRNGDAFMKYERSSPTML